MQTRPRVATVLMMANEVSYNDGHKEIFLIFLFSLAEYLTSEECRNGRKAATRSNAFAFFLLSLARRWNENSDVLILNLSARGRVNANK